MRILVLGKGGREHALCWRLKQSPSVRELYCAGTNPGIEQLAKPVPVSAADFGALAAFARDQRIDLTVVGPEAPLAEGIVDEFEQAGLRILGPSKAAAQLEASKSFAKAVMREAGVPTADFATFDDAEAAKQYARKQGGPLVVKADGLAAGKGVTVCDDTEGALRAVAEAMEERKFGAAGQRVVIEERLRGEELSFFALCDGNDAVALGTAQDHKRAFDGDRGPNTGGMGAYSPVTHLGAALDERLMAAVIRPVLRAMKARAAPFRGVLYAGLMVDGERLNVLELNVRMGDPECEPLMMRFEGDLGEAFVAAAEGRLHRDSVQLSPKSAVAVVLASGGYPGDYPKGLPITGLERLEGPGTGRRLAEAHRALKGVRVEVFHAGTAIKAGRLVTDGGRVLVVTAMANDLRSAIEAAYEAAEMIHFEGKHLRRDIGRRALERAG